MEDKRVHKLIIDSCNIRDETLSTILEAINEQSQRNFNGQMVRQYLSSFIISNTHLGP